MEFSLNSPERAQEMNETCLGVMERWQDGVQTTNTN